MIRQLSLLVITCLLSQFSFAYGIAANRVDDKVEKRTTKVKASIMKLGVGRDAQTEVKLVDDRKVAGFIRESTDTYFILENPKTGAGETILYSQVRSVKGKNMSTGVKVLIGVGIALGTLLFISLLFDD